MPDMKNGASLALWTLGVLVWSGIARIGWEIGGHLWAAI